MPHHYLHDDLLEEHKRNIKLSQNRGKAVCARCGDVVHGEHYVGKDATIFSHEAEGSDAEIKVCKSCYSKETGFNIGQYQPAYEPEGQTRHKKGF